MTDEERAQFNAAMEELAALRLEFMEHRHTGLDVRQLDGTSFEETPFAHISDPSDAGATYNQSQVQEIVDSVKSILSILETIQITSDQ